MTAETLLDRLDKVKRTGGGRWSARCPAHPDKSPSLAVRELPDGRVLVHCFAGCGVDSILTAVGLELSDLYPDKPGAAQYTKSPKRELFNALDVLQALAHEALVVDAAAAQIQVRGYLKDDEAERLALASDRIAGGLGYATRHA